MNWTLILTYMVGNAATIHSVPNFDSKEAANTAGQTWKESLGDHDIEHASFVVVNLFGT